MFGRLASTSPQIYFSAYGGRYSGFASLDINRRLLAPLSANLIDQTFYHYGWDVNDQQIVVSVLVEDKVLLTLFDLQQRSYRRLTQDGKSFYPVYSPDRNYIAFQFYDGEKSEIYVIDVDGNNKRRLTNTQSDSLVSTPPIWSPDGRHILFETTGSNLSQKIYTIDIDGIEQRQLTSDNEWNGQSVWSPDSRFIAFTSTRDSVSEIYVMNADGTNQQRLTNNIEIDDSPAWSPNGDLIAFASNRGSLTIEEKIYIMQADGSQQRLLAGTGGGDNFPRWSPDGQQILFYGGKDQKGIDSLNGLTYMVNVDGSNLQQLTSDKMQLNPYRPVWYLP